MHPGQDCDGERSIFKQSVVGNIDELTRKSDWECQNIEDFLFQLRPKHEMVWDKNSGFNFPTSSNDAVVDGSTSQRHEQISSALNTGVWIPHANTLATMDGLSAFIALLLQELGPYESLSEVHGMQHVRKLWGTIKTKRNRIVRVRCLVVFAPHNAPSILSIYWFVSLLILIFVVR